jgi:hypothetical protein
MMMTPSIITSKLSYLNSSEDVTALMKQQLSVVKSSLGAISHSLSDVEYNEELLKQGIGKVTDYMNALKSEEDANINLVSAKVEVEGHILRVNSAGSTLQRKLYLLVNNVMKAQKGILHPR